MNIAVGSVTYNSWQHHCCRKCGKLLSEGLHSVMAIIEYDDGYKEHHKIIIWPPLICCDEPLEVQQLFQTESQAEAKAREVREKLSNFTEANAALFVIHSEFHQVP